MPTGADDIFALGSVLYFIMTGEEIFSGMDDEEVEHHFFHKNLLIMNSLGQRNIFSRVLGWPLPDSSQLRTLS